MHLSAFSSSVLQLIMLVKFVCALTDKISICTNKPISKNSTTLEELNIPYHFMKSNVTQDFRFISRDIECSASAITNKISNALEPSFYFLASGDIVVPAEEYFLTTEFCISRFEDDLIEIKHCEVECGVTHTCIYKCCPPNEIVDFSNGESLCKIASGPRWKPFFYDRYEGCGVKTQSPINYHLLQLPESNSSEFIQPYKHIEVNTVEEDEETNSTIDVVAGHDGLRFRLMKDGYLYIQESLDGHWELINQSEFCIDGMTGYIGSKPYDGDLDDQMLLLRIFNWDFDEPHGRLEVVYIVLMFIGAAFLLTISILYLLIWEKHNIHGWTIFAFVTTMLFMFIFLAMAKIYTRSMTHEFGGTVSCKSVGILAHFFYLSTMCWLTVINVDLWLTFRSQNKIIKNVKPSGGTSQSLIRFILYSLFAYGIPFLIVGFALSLDHIYEGGFGDGSECEPPVVLPRYGEDTCYIRKQAYWPYLYIPMSILISFNTLTFFSTVITLFLYRRKTRHAVSGTNHQQESVVLFGKLFIVTGISWAFELLSNAVYYDLWWLWLIFDSYNLLQAVLIFLIFAAKRENLLLLYHKYPRSRILLKPIMKAPCCYSFMFDPERTEVTGVPFDYRNSRISFRRGSNLSTSAMMSSSVTRRGSDDF